jgi:hypothetical protein
MTDFDPIAELEQQLDGILHRADEALSRLRPDYDTYIAGVDALAAGTMWRTGDPYRGRHASASFEEWLGRAAHGRRA